MKIKLTKEIIMNETQYKFLRLVKGKIKSDSGNHIWKVGKWSTKRGKVELCKKGFHSSKRIIDALSYVKGEVVARVEISGQIENDKNKSVASKMRIIDARYWTKEDSVELAIFAAEQVIDIYENKYPNDKRPREAIEAAKEYLKNPTKNAAYTAYTAADEAGDADAEYTTYAARAAARAAAYTAYTTAYTTYTTNNTCTAYTAVRAAADAAADVLDKIEDYLLKKFETLKKVK